MESWNFNSFFGHCCLQKYFDTFHNARWRIGTKRSFIWFLTNWWHLVNWITIAYYSGWVNWHIPPPQYSPNILVLMKCMKHMKEMWIFYVHSPQHFSSFQFRNFVCLWFTSSLVRRTTYVVCTPSKKHSWLLTLMNNLYKC